MKIFAVFASLASPLLIASPSLAQDADPVRAGFYVGPMIGIDRFAGDEADGEVGLVYGALAGYDFSDGDLLVGVEAELLESSSKDSERDIFLDDDELRLGVGLDLHLGLRAGYRIGGSGLLFVKGGYTNLDVNARYTAVGITPIKGKESLDGFRVGAGGEFTMARNVSARLEYRYSEYDGGEADPTFGDLALQRHQGTLSLVFRV